MNTDQKEIGTPRRQGRQGRREEQNQKQNSVLLPSYLGVLGVLAFLSLFLSGLICVHLWLSFYSAGLVSGGLPVRTWYAAAAMRPAPGVLGWTRSGSISGWSFRAAYMSISPTFSSFATASMIGISACRAVSLMPKLP